MAIREEDLYASLPKQDTGPIVDRIIEYGKLKEKLALAVDKSWYYPNRKSN